MITGQSETPSSNSNDSITWVKKYVIRLRGLSAAFTLSGKSYDGIADNLVQGSLTWHPTVRRIQPGFAPFKRTGRVIISTHRTGSSIHHVMASYCFCKWSLPASVTLESHVFAVILSSEIAHVIRFVKMGFLPAYPIRCTFCDSRTVASFATGNTHRLIHVWCNFIRLK